VCGTASPQDVTRHLQAEGPSGFACWHHWQAGQEHRQYQSSAGITMDFLHKLKTVSAANHEAGSKHHDSIFKLLSPLEVSAQNNFIHTMYRTTAA